MRNALRAIAAALAAFAFLATPAFAATAQGPVVIGAIQAHPALWTVHGPKGTAYLFGSIHVLPPNMKWHTPQVDSAMAASDTFVFEIPMDDATKTDIQDFVRNNGFLPADTSLPSLLNDEARKDYIAALALTHVAPESLVDKRPWLAMLLLNIGYMMHQHLSPDAGVDKAVYAAAQARGKVSFGAFETPEQQFKLFMPANQKLEIEEFDVGLKDLRDDKDTLGDLIDDWAHADEKGIDALMNAGFKGHPEVEKALFDDRNHAWIARIETMLREPHIYFITVGAGHLAGPKGVPALLRARGYKVDGP